MMDEEDELDQSLNAQGSFYGATNEKLTDLINKSNQYTINTHRFMVESKSGLLQTARTIGITPSDINSIRTNIINQNNEGPFDKSIMGTGQKFNARRSNYTSENQVPKWQPATGEFQNFNSTRIGKRGQSEEKPYRKAPVIGVPAARLKNIQFSINLESQGLNCVPKRALNERDRVQILNLNSNAFKLFPAEIVQLRNLRVLLLENNFIRKIPSEIFYSLVSLENLSLRNNLLQEIPASIVNLSSSLVSLNVSHNHVEKIEEFLGYLEKLKILHINNNDFFQLPVKLRFLRKTLQELKLEWFRYLIPEQGITQTGYLLDQLFDFLALERKESFISFHEYLKYATNNNFSINHLDSNINSLLHTSVIYEDHGIVKALLNMKCEHIDRANIEGETPLSIAIREDKFFAAKILLYNGSNINLKNGVMGSYLNLASAKLQIYIVQDLINLGVDINQRDLNGNSALHYVMSVFGRDPNSSEKICDILLDQGADPNAMNNDHWAPIHIAVKRGQKEALDFIIKYNEKLSQNMKQKIRINSLNANEKKKAIPFNLEKRGGSSKWSPLHLAAFFNFADLQQKLLEKGVDVTIKNVQGFTAKDIIPKSHILRKMLISYEKKAIYRNVISKINAEYKKANTLDYVASIDDAEIDENEESRANNLENNFNKLNHVIHLKNKPENGSQPFAEVKYETIDTSDADSAEVEDDVSYVHTKEELLEEFEESNIKPLNMKCGSNNIRKKDRHFRFCDKLRVAEEPKNGKDEEQSRLAIDTMSGMVQKQAPGTSLEAFIEMVKKLNYFISNLTSSLKKLETNFLKKTELVKEVTLLYENKEEHLCLTHKYQKSLEEKALSIFILMNLMRKLEGHFYEVHKEKRIISKLQEMEKKGVDNRFKREFKENCRLSIEEIVATLNPEKELMIHESIQELISKMGTSAGDSLIKARLLQFISKKNQVKAVNHLTNTVLDTSSIAEIRYEAFQSLLFVKQSMVHKRNLLEKLTNTNPPRSLSSARIPTKSIMEQPTNSNNVVRDNNIASFGKRSNSLSRNESSLSFQGNNGYLRAPVEPPRRK